MTTIDSIFNDSAYDTPWGWQHDVADFKVRSFDSTDTTTFLPADVSGLVHTYANGDRWDGDCVVVGRLNDGRWFAWESWYGPTGSGFHGDAYGGGVEVIVAASYESLLPWITEEGRRKIGVA